MNDEPTGQRRGQIYDVGYRPFEGQYQGRGVALAGLIWDDMKRAFGIKQSGRYKVILIILVAIEAALLATQVFSSQLMESMATQQGVSGVQFNPYSSLLGSIQLILIFISAMAAPMLICTDRAYGVYPLYLSRPIHAYDYLLAKGSAVFGVLLLFTLGPGLILLGAKIVLAGEPLSYLTNHLRDVGALLVSSVLMALFVASLAMAVSSLTTSRGYAAGGLIGGLMLLSFVPSLLFLITQNPWFTLVDISSAATYVKDALFGTLQSVQAPINIGDESSTVNFEPLSAWVYLAETLALIAVSWAVIWGQYRREVR